MFILAAVLLVQFLSIVSAQNWIVAESFASFDCSDASSEVSVLKQTAVCMAIPAALADSLPLFYSYKLAPCSSSGSEMFVTAKAYASYDCTGFSVAMPLDPLSTVCSIGSRVSCQDSPQAIVEKLPAVGIYVEDAQTCTAPQFIVSAGEGCSSLDAFSLSMNCEADALNFAAYNASATCDGIASFEAALGLDSCIPISDGALPPDVLATIEEMIASYVGFEIDLSSIEAAYVAGCAGAAELPGVDFSSTDGTSGDSNGSDTLSYGGLGPVGLALLVSFLGIGVLASLYYSYYSSHKITHVDKNNLIDKQIPSDQL